MAESLVVDSPTIVLIRFDSSQALGWAISREDAGLQRWSSKPDC